MKKKHFYENIIQINDITLDLAGIELTKEERLHLLALVEANVHSTVINTVLSQLSADDKKIFLKNLIEDDHNQIWTHLNQNTEDLEEKILKSVDGLIKEMREDINKAKKK
jgi:Mg/Co/Ni transporter MgtE